MAKQNSEKNKKTQTGKNIKLSAIKYEMIKKEHLILNALLKYKILPQETAWYEPEVRHRLEGNPSEADMDKILMELGY